MDLNMMMRQQALSGLQTQLDAAVTNGDLEGARKVAADIAKLEVSTAPKAPPFGDVEIKAALAAKAPWFGVDPRKSGKAVTFGKDMDPKKFATAEAFADALIKAVDEEFKPAGTVEPKGEGEEDDTVTEGEEDDTTTEDPPKKRKTDAPGEHEAVGRTVPRGAKGPWTKLSDAPADIQKEVKRQADKFVPASAPKEQREKFVTNALGSHYAAHLRNKGKK